MTSAQQANPSRIIREAMEKAIVWADKTEVDLVAMNSAEVAQRHDDIALALGILHKWREEEAE